MKKNFTFAVQNLDFMRVVFCFKKLTYSLVILCILTFLPNAVDGQSQRTFEVGELSVYTEYDYGAEVYIDGKFAGVVPFHKKISVGNHYIVVKQDMFYDYEDVITITKKANNLFLKLSPKFGIMKVSTKPAGATISFNGAEFPGLTPCVSERLMAGDIAVSIKLSEYKTLDTVVTVNEGKVSSLSVTLEKLDIAPTMSTFEYEEQLYGIETAKTSSTPKETNSKVTKSKLFAKKGHKDIHEVWLKIGSGLSHVYGKDVGSWSEGNFYSIYPTFHAGVQYNARIKRYLCVGVELNYSRTGYQYSYLFQDEDLGVIEKFKFNNLEIPVFARYYFLKNKLGPLVELGAIMAYCKKVNIDYTFSDGTSKTQSRNYKSANFGLIGGVGYDFKIGKMVFTANIRAVLELSNLFSNVNHKLVYFQYGVGVKIF